MESVVTQDSWCFRDVLPVEHGHVVAVGSEAIDDLVDLDVVGSVLRDGQEQGGAGCQPVEDLDEFGLVAQRVAAVVGTEEDDRRAPVVIRCHVEGEESVEYPVAEVDESARLSLDLHLPAEGYHCVTHVIAIPRRCGCEDRVTDHQDPVPLGDLADELRLGAVLVHRGAYDDDRLAYR